MATKKQKRYLAVGLALVFVIILMVGAFVYKSMPPKLSDSCTKATYEWFYDIDYKEECSYVSLYSGRNNREINVVLDFRDKTIKSPDGLDVNPADEFTYHTQETVDVNGIKTSKYFADTRSMDISIASRGVKKSYEVYYPDIKLPTELNSNNSLRVESYIATKDGSVVSDEEIKEFEATVQKFINLHLQGSSNQQ